MTPMEIALTKPIGSMWTFSRYRNGIDLPSRAISLGSEIMNIALDECGSKDEDFLNEWNPAITGVQERMFKTAYISAILFNSNLRDELFNLLTEIEL